MRGLFEGARTIKPGQKWLRELFKGAVFSRARSDQGNTVGQQNFTTLSLCDPFNIPFFFCFEYTIVNRALDRYAPLFCSRSIKLIDRARSIQENTVCLKVYSKLLLMYTNKIQWNLRAVDNFSTMDTICATNLSIVERFHCNHKV